jgi:hypothetical protein
VPGDDEREEAEAAEDVTEAEETDVSRADVPEADALEQRQELRPGDGPPREIGDRPEGDALEQALPAGDDEDDDRR